MREQTVIADRQTEAGQQPHADEKAQLHHPDRPVEQQAQCDKRADQGQDIEYDKMPPLHLVQVPASDDPNVAHARTGNILVSQSDISTGSNRQPQPLRDRKRSGSCDGCGRLSPVI
jgi:hypothetical protein